MEVAPGDTGEIQVRGYSLMQGYYKKPAETAASYTADGWFRTGDSGLIREDGYLRFLGRYKDMLKVGGENVDPMEVEGPCSNRTGSPRLRSSPCRTRPLRSRGGLCPALTGCDAHGDGRDRLAGARSRASRSRATCRSSTSFQ